MRPVLAKPPTVRELSLQQLDDLIQGEQEALHRCPCEDITWHQHRLEEFKRWRRSAEARR